MNDQLQQPIRFAEFELDELHRVLRRHGQPLALNAKAFDVLVFLVVNAGRVVSKDEILDAVWENQFVEEANLKVQISALRKALGERKDEHRLLVTIPGKGYKFVADIQSNGHEIIIEKHKFSRLVVEEEKGIKRWGDGEKNFQRPNNSLSPLLPFSLSRKIAIAASVAFLILIIGGGFFWLFNRIPAPPNHDNLVQANEKQLNLKRLTNQGRVNRAKISPDGKFFAYTITEKGSYRTEIRLGQIDPRSDFLLSPRTDVFHHPISFSADGNWLYYVNTQAVSEEKEWKGPFYKLPVLGGVPQRLGDSISIYSVLSPDEKQIAFPRNNSQTKTSAIVIANPNGSDEREIAIRPLDQTIDVDSLSWSADGRFIAFSAATERKNDTARKSYEIFVVHLSDGKVDQITSLEWTRILLLEWLKDGRGLIGVARSNEQENSSSLWQIDYPSGKTERISRDVNRYAGSLSLSATSSGLIAIQQEVETNLWLAPADNLSAAKQITFGTAGRQDGWRGADWAPDGRIVYTAWIDESLTIWSMNSDGANPRQLTSTGFRDEKPVVTTDGGFIVFQSNRSGANEIWRMDIDGGHLQPLTKDGGNYHPSLTSDSRWVIYRHAKDNGSLWRIPLAGGEPLLIANQNALVPRVSPDGKLVAGGLEVEGKTKLALFSIETGELVKLFEVSETHNFRTGNGIDWSPDRRFIYYPDESNGIWRQNLNGGEPVRLEGIPAERSFSYSWSPDGKQLVFGRAREVREAVLISDFR